ncbi:undecaprenyl-diphosphatase [Halovenus aranensis]|uniref:Undecaprenyl-diphosphatase n=1 Tax=Halovenus aranensis TaxID=890420 RepID=A0A1G8XUK7_9EURY|nr:undecaprenyl-diphosphate phosphatase [Halovenus aranensis]SDJ94269.1 undecaprenyl-diphosphatase [Halovenus aranensis]
MNWVDLVIAILAGVVQGVVEWLPISSQGNLALFLTTVGTDPDIALQLALFLQVGTTLSAATYFRSDIADVVQTLRGWRDDSDETAQSALIIYLVTACAMTGIVGIPLYIFAVDVASELAGGAFVAVIGVLLVATGVFQLRAESTDGVSREEPTVRDSVLVGAAQGLAILPGISRSGMTSSVLLFRHYDPPEAFRLSFLLSIPAALGAAVLTVAGAGGLPGISPTAAAAALVVSGFVGYLAIDAIMRVVDRVPFWTVCFGLGGVAILGGVLALAA